MCLSSRYLNGLDSQLDPLSPTQGSDQAEILIFTIDTFVYKWWKLLILEITSINYYLVIIGCHWLHGKSDTTIQA